LTSMTHRRTGPRCAARRTTTGDRPGPASCHPGTGREMHAGRPAATGPMPLPERAQRPPHHGHHVHGASGRNRAAATASAGLGAPCPRMPSTVGCTQCLTMSKSTATAPWWARRRKGSGSAEEIQPPAILRSTVCRMPPLR
jgi:hypothetical protein